DTLGANWKHYEQAGPGRGEADFSQWAREGGGRQYSRTYTSEDFGGTDFSDFFNAFFRGDYGNDPGNIYGQGQTRGRQEVQRKGEDYEARLEIPLEEAFHGSKRILNVNGEKISIVIPPGVTNGQVLRVKGKGGKGRRGGESGHLYLHVEMLPDPRYDRQGDDLYTDLHVPLYKAILGGEVPVLTMKGTFTMKIPKETSNGKTLRMKGLGMPVYQKKNLSGDLYLRIIIDIPQNLNQEEISLFKKLSSLRPV
ncbi:MAG: DnaJ C-terminal domain-containing protein, partial [Deltaproteobacteria bacterium]